MLRWGQMPLAVSVSLLFTCTEPYGGYAAGLNSEVSVAHADGVVKPHSKRELALTFTAGDQAGPRRYALECTLQHGPPIPIEVGPYHHC